MKKILYALLALSSYCANGYAGSYEPLSQWMVFNNEYGFTNNSINRKLGIGGTDVVGTALLSNGQRAFAVTGQGIVLYDGKTMSIQKMPKDCFAAMSDMTCMAAAPNDILWIGTVMGLVKYENGTYTNIPYDQTKLQVITDLAITNSGKVYASGYIPGYQRYAGGGVSFFNGSSWENMNMGQHGLPDSLMSELTIDDAGFLWAIPGEKRDTGIAKFDGEDWRFYNAASGLPVTTIKALTKDADGKIWAATTKGIMKNDEGVWTMKMYSNGFSPKLGELLSSRNGELRDITSLMVEPNGSIWIGTMQGLYLLKQGGLRILNRYNSPLNSDIVGQMSVDKDGYKWICTGARNASYFRYGMESVRNRVPYLNGGGGVTVYREHAKVADPKWTVYDSASAPIETSYCLGMAEDKEGTVWMNDMRNGLVSLKDGKFSVYKTEKALHNGFTALYLAPDGKIFLPATVGGLKVFQNGAITDFAKNPAMGGITALTYDKDNVLWACGPNGIHKYVNNDWESFKKGDGLPSIIVYTIMKDSKNALWAGTGKGLVTYDGTAWKEVGADVDFPSNDFTAITEDKNGKLLLGTNKGLSIYNGTTFENIPKVESLKMNKYKINKITVDKNNAAWIGTESYGLVKYDGTNWTQFSKGSGYPLYDRITSVLITHDGKMFISSESTSFSEFDPQLPTSDKDELAKQDIMRRVKLAEPRKVLAIYDMN